MSCLDLQRFNATQAKLAIALTSCTTHVNSLKHARTQKALRHAAVAVGCFQNRSDSRVALLQVGRESSAPTPAAMFTWPAAHKRMTTLQRVIQTITDGRPSRPAATCSAISQHAEHL